MKTLLVDTPHSQVRAMPSLGLGCLSSYLRSRGHKTRIIEFSNNYGEEINKTLCSFRPDIVGISIWCSGFQNAMKLTQYLARKHPHVIRVAGGPLASFMPNRLLERENFHYVIAGPGEIALTKLIEELTICKKDAGKTVKGVYYAGCKKKKEFGEIPRDISNYPFPDRGSGINYTFPNSLMMNRGCNQRCIFCAKPAIPYIVKRSVTNVMDEIDILLKSEPTKPILFMDDNIAIFSKQIEELCQSLKASKKIIWTAQVRVDINQLVLEEMRSAGCCQISLGVESGDQKVLDNINKGIRLAQVEQTVKAMSSLGIAVALYYMLGHYCDTPQTFQSTLDHAKKMKDKYNAIILLSCNTLYPGSPQYLMREKLGFKIHTSSWDDYDERNPTISARHFKLKDLREKYYQSRCFWPDLLKLHHILKGSTIDK
jgi:radical SAM superfamily enzyme YgiQ (UPF0313 family)